MRFIRTIFILLPIFIVTSSFADGVDVKLSLPSFVDVYQFGSHGCQSRFFKFMLLKRRIDIDGNSINSYVSMKIPISFVSMQRDKTEAISSIIDEKIFIAIWNNIFMKSISKLPGHIQDNAYISSSQRYFYQFNWLDDIKFREKTIKIDRFSTDLMSSEKDTYQSCFKALIESMPKKNQASVRKLNREEIIRTLTEAYIVINDLQSRLLIISALLAMGYDPPFCMDGHDSITRRHYFIFLNGYRKCTSISNYKMALVDSDEEVVYRATESMKRCINSNNKTIFKEMLVEKLKEHEKGFKRSCRKKCKMNYGAVFLRDNRGKIIMDKDGNKVIIGFLGDSIKECLKIIEEHEGK